MKSTDGGGSWQTESLPNNTGGLTQIVCPSTSDCYAIGEIGGDQELILFVVSTSNGGATWVEDTAPYFADEGPGGENWLTCSAVDDCSILAFYGGGDIVLVSTTNGGTSWGSVSLPSGIRYAGENIDCPSSSVCYLVSNNSAESYDQAVFVTTNGGTSWTTSITLPSPDQITGISCTSVSDCFISGYGASATGFIEATTNSGSTWSSQTLPSGVTAVDSISCFSSSDCTAPTTNGTSYGIITTSNGGTSWSSETSPGDVVAVSCSSGNDCVATTGANLYYTTNTGSSWSTATVPLAEQLFDMSCPTSSTCFAIGSNSAGSPVVDTTTNGGSTWTLSGGPSGVQLESISCPSTTVCFAITLTDYVYETTNAGSSWTATEMPDSGLDDSNLSAISCPSVLVCYTVAFADSTGTDVFSTTNEGGSWALVSSTGYSAYGEPEGISCPTASTCYLSESVTEGGGDELYVTTNSFGTVTKIATSEMDSYQEATGITCPTTEDCYLTVFSYYSGDELAVLSTNNGGSSWNTHLLDPNFPDSGDGGGPTITGNVACISGSTCIASGSLANGDEGPETQLTTDGGTTWNPSAPISGPLACASGGTCYEMAQDGVPNGISTSIYSDGTGTWTSAPPVGGMITSAELMGGVNLLAPGACDCYDLFGGPVDAATGDFFVSATDADVATDGPQLSFSRTYDADLAQSEASSSAPGPLGYGWTDNWNENLAINGTTGAVTVNQGSGAEETFVPPSAGTCPTPDVGPGTSGTYCALPRVTGSLVYNSSTSKYTLTLASGTTYTFNSSGTLTAITDRDGLSDTLAYNSPSPGSGECPSTATSCEAITSASGRVLTLGWSGSSDSGSITSVTDPLGRRTFYGYSSGNLVSVTDPLSRVTSYTYDSGNSNSTLQHDLLTIKDPNAQSGGPDAGDVVTNTYDSSGRVTEQVDAAGNATSFNYSAMNTSTGDGTVIVTDPDGNEIEEIFYDGELIHKITGYGTSSTSETTYGYDPATLMATSVTDPNGNTTNSTYNASADLTAQTNALNETTTYSYNSFNEPTCTAAPLAASPCSSLSPPSAITAGTATITPPSSTPPAYVTYTEYDTKGNKIWTTTGVYAPGSSTASYARTSYWLYSGQSVTIGSTADSCTTTPPSSELPCATIDPDGVVTQLAYDSAGDLTSSSTPDGNGTSGAAGTISTFAGGTDGSESGTSVAQLPPSVSTATVGGTTYAYVTDGPNNLIRRVNVATDQEIIVAGAYQWGNTANGTAATSSYLEGPQDAVADSSGDLVIADTSANLIKYVPATTGTYFGISMTAGDMYTIAGNGTAGYSGNTGAATSAELNGPTGVALGPSGGIAFTDYSNNDVRFIPATTATFFGIAMTANHIYTIAGNGTAGSSGNGGIGTSAELHGPVGIAVDSSGDVAVADATNNLIRFVANASGTHFGTSMTAGYIYAIAGTGTSGESGDTGAATSAKIAGSEGVSFDSSGDLAIADTNNDLVRFVPATSGTYFATSMTADDIYKVAGNSSASSEGNGGPALSALLAGPEGVAIDGAGDLIVADAGAEDVRIVPATSGTLVGQSVTAGDIYLLAGNGYAKYSGDGGPAYLAEVGDPQQVRTDAAGDLVIADAGDEVVRFVPKTSGTYFGIAMTANDIYTVAGIGGYFSYSGNGGAATSAALNDPAGVALGSSGLVIADTGNNVIRFVPKTSGTYFGTSMTANYIYTIAGNGTAGYSGNTGVATSAELKGPTGVAVDSSGGVLIADDNNNVIRYLPATSGTYFGVSMTAGHLYTIAGTTTSGYTGNAGAATSAELDNPEAVNLDASGNVVIADTTNSVVRFIPITSGSHYGTSMTADDIYTIAGNGTTGDSGDTGLATSGTIGYDWDATVDAAGDLFLPGADSVRFVPAASGTYYGTAMTADHIYTVAGQAYDVGFSGDGGPASSALIDYPLSVVPAPSGGGYYIADTGNLRVRYVSGSSSTPELATTTMAYDGDGEATSVTSPDGNLSGANAANYASVTTFDADGETTQSTQGGGTGATVTARTASYGYDADGNQTSMTDARGYVTHHAFNADDEQTMVTDPDSQETLTCYDGDGNVAETVPAIGVAANSLTASSCPTSYPSGYGDRLATDATTSTYDAQGDLITKTTPAPAGETGYETTSYTYDPGRRLTQVSSPPTTTTSGAANNLTTYNYDAANEVTSETAGSGSSAASTTSYCYDPDGDKTATVAPDGNASSVATCATSSPWQTTSSYQTGYSYDSNGELVSETRPATAVDTSGMTTSYTYNADGDATTSTQPSGVVTTNTFTPLDQLSGTTYSDSTHAVSDVYDANGNRVSMTDATGSTTDVYDPFGELTSETNGNGATVSYSYDKDGDTTGITYPISTSATWPTTDTVAYTYDNADEMSSVTDFNSHAVSVTNNADGLPTSLTLGSSGDTISTTYDATDSPSAINLKQGSTTLLGFSYSDTPAGGVASETDTPSSSIEPASYTYDSQSRVTEMTPGTSTALNYAYDASDNLTTLPTSATATYDDSGALTSSTLSSTTTNYAYNANGDQTTSTQGSSTITTGAWNGANELTSFSDSAANMSASTYDGDGLRITETTGTGGSAVTQDFVWNTTSSVPQSLMDGTNAYIYGPNSGPIEQVNLSTGTLKYLAADSLGSVRGVVTSSGSLTASTSYSAYGNPETTGGLTSYTPFGFAGAYTDGTGLGYLVNRYYEPAIGQFLSVDQMVDETGEPYSYALGNPVDTVDPSGLIPIDEGNSEECIPSYYYDTSCPLSPSQIDNSQQGAANYYASVSGDDPFDAIGTFIYDHAQLISAIAAVAAEVTIVFVPGVGLGIAGTFEVISTVTGAIATTHDLRDHQYVAAVFDGAGTLLGVGSGGAKIASRILDGRAAVAVDSGRAFLDLVRGSTSAAEISEKLSKLADLTATGSFLAGQVAPHLPTAQGARSANASASSGSPC